MPIRPIDLQTLLMQMSQVQKDQAVEKDAPVVQSALQAAAAAKREIETKDAVGRPEEPKDGAGPVKDRMGRPRERAGKGKEGDEGEGEEAPHEEVVKDPTLGNRVDLSG
jgi:hypothetical protein